MFYLFNKVEGIERKAQEHKTKYKSNLEGNDLNEYFDLANLSNKKYEILSEQIALQSINTVSIQPINQSNNILLSNTLELKLIDFGCAKEINENDFRQYKWSDTIKYSEPEVHYSPETFGYDGVKNDIFFLGIMLFTLLFGFYPFTKPNIAIPIYKLFVEEEYRNQKIRDIRELLARTKDFFKATFKIKSTYLGEKIPLNQSGDITND